ncbi:MAG: NADH-quinone oxidoreductase subunit NuoF [Firmicutes bacterium HGW-Firmicutes-8]|nr:MAG: NADH-quinone oxidoreductase subunit NuoF [Firmicutes bacterium HGW-Firmicutes-8]
MNSLAEKRKTYQDQLAAKAKKTVIVVGLGTCGIAAGGEKIWSAIKGEINNKKLDIEMVYSGCVGMCYKEPIIEVHKPGMPRVIYGDVNPENALQILQDHAVNGKVVNDLAVAQDPKEGAAKLPDVPVLNELPFYKKQVKTAIAKCGVINPDSIEEYIAFGGYEALEKVLTGMSQVEVIDEVKKSGLRGRGGGGFSTGLKWEFANKAQGDKKYVVCNADEGDPGAFMDRSVLEGDPHAVLEGMAICGYSIGADEGYIYCRAEYPLAIKRLETAIARGEEAGLLGKNILGTGFNFKLKIKAGAGAFVCGEETALINSIEGKRGMPRVRPPFPAQSGLWAKPTNNNNVETYANIPNIIRQGSSWFASMGTEKSKGSKVFALTGKVNRTGLAEVPVGITIREIIFEIAGGIQDNKKFKAVQIGGPSGGCIPEEHLDTPVDYDSLIALGAMMGSGGLVVMDETTCMVDVARFFLNFTKNESCGKCTPCREGTKRMLEILETICAGKGKPEDITTLERLSTVIKSTALCGLGQTAPNPVLATLKYFRSEYEDHIFNKKCPAGVCNALLEYKIDAEKCKGCGSCKKVCPVEAISGEKKQPHEIDTSKCIKCGSCIEKCKLDAIIRG